MSETIIMRNLGTLDAEQALSPTAQQLGVNEYVNSANNRYEEIADDADGQIRQIPSNKDFTPQGRTKELNRIQNAAAAQMRAVFDQKQPALDALVKRANDGLPTFPIIDKADLRAEMRAAEIRAVVRPMSVSERRAFWTAAAAAGNIGAISAVTDDPAGELMNANDDPTALKNDALRAKYPGKFAAPDAAAEIIALLRSNLQTALGAIGRSDDLNKARAV